MQYELKQNHIHLESDFLFRKVLKDEGDVDIWIAVEGRCVNIVVEGAPEFLLSRLQFPRVRWVIIRMTNDSQDGAATIHFLGDEGRASSFCNFELQLKQVKLIFRKDEEGAPEFKIIRKNLLKQ